MADQGGAALVLTAGAGTRLWPLTALRAKPAVPVAGTPLVRRILAWLARQGLRHVVLNLHHLPDSIAAVVGDGSDLGLRVRYSWEQPLLGSAGGPRHALPLLDADRFWIVNGDTLADVDLAAVADRHARTGALVTMALVPNPRPDKYGGVIVRNDWVTGFTPPGAGEPTYHFIGVQIAEARVFADLPDGEPAESVSAVYRAMLAASERAIGAHVCDATFRDIGTPVDYLRTSLELARRGSTITDRLGGPAPSGPSSVDTARLIGARSRIAPGARLARTVVWDDVVIEDGVELADCVVGDGARVAAGARFANRVLVPAARVERRPGAERVGDLLVTPLD